MLSSTHHPNALLVIIHGEAFDQLIPRDLKHTSYKIIPSLELFIFRLRLYLT
jgi:hypothetical protein